MTLTNGRLFEANLGNSRTFKASNSEHNLRVSRPRTNSAVRPDLLVVGHDAVGDADDHLVGTLGVVEVLVEEVGQVGGDARPHQPDALVQSGQVGGERLLCAQDMRRLLSSRGLLRKTHQSYYDFD